MSRGKMASQAGHAYLDAAADAMSKDLALFEDYQENHRTKVALASDSLEKLLLARNRAESLGVPCSLVVEEMEGFHGDHPTPTALGFGPCDRATSDRVTDGMFDLL